MTRYPLIVGMDECAYYGVDNPNAVGYACGEILTPHQRMFIEESLALAQERIEQILGFPLAPKFVGGERHKWNNHGIISPLRWGYVQAIGELTSDDISLGAALNLGLEANPNDPVGLVVASTLTNTCEVKVYHVAANGGGAIEPSDVTADGVNITISIPRCRLVNPTLTQPTTGFDYNINANFVDEVDIVHEYIEAGTGSSIVWLATNLACLDDCEERTQAACPTIADSPLSIVRMFPATYSAGAWAEACLEQIYSPDLFSVSYVAHYNDPMVLPYAGCSEIPLALERAIIRLAHCEMPRRPCMCQWHKQMWEDDREVPEAIPMALLANPFGERRGELYAARVALNYAQGRGGLF